MNLPNEIFQIVFSHLPVEELKECQITCRAWYTSATEKLYTHIRLLKPYSVVSLMELLTSSPEYGLVIKTLQIDCAKDSSVWENNTLLNLIIKHCPNLVCFTSYQGKQEFWERLSLAGESGELKLQEIQSLIRGRDAEAIKYYNRTALAFKETLVSLELCDQVSQMVEPPILYQQEFLGLAQRLDEFKALKTLNILLHSDQGILAIDKIIDRCANLKRILLSIMPTGVQPPIPTGLFCKETVRPRTDIKYYQGQDIILDDHNSLLYFMHKFPNLDRLYLTRSRWNEVIQNADHPRIASLIAFFDYISKIPTVVIEIDPKGISLDAMYEALINKRTTVSKKLDIHYYNDKQNFLLKEDGVRLRYSPYECLNSMVHAPLLEKFGYMLESLSVEGIVGIQASLMELSHHEGVANLDAYGNWLIHILTHCPNLKELDVDAGGTIDIDDSLLEEHLALKKLTLRGIEDASVLAKVTAKTPSITHVCAVISQTSETTLTTLDMSTTSLEILGWEYSAYGYQSSINICIEVTTTSNDETFYFIADKERAIRYTKHDYQQALLEIDVDLTFDIKCKSLKTFHFNYRCGIYFDQSYFLNV